MKITKVSIKGLFGFFDHEISLNAKEKITIIHSLNGFGKTNILRILNGLINQKYSRIKNIPFNQFKIFFDNNNILEIQKNLINKNESTEEQILLNFYINDKKSSSYDIIKDSQNERSKASNSLLNKLTNDDLLDKSKTQFGILESLPEEPHWLDNIRSNIDVKFIESSTLSKVSACSKELAEIMQNQFHEYAKKSQLLDQSFLVRVLEQQNTAHLTNESFNINLKFDELESIYTHLINLGLLDKSTNSDSLVQREDINKNTQTYLSIYVDIIKQKLNIFDEIARKIDLLRKIINCKFACSYKEINFSRKQGFIITSCYPNSSQSKIISLADLSSGEQHELVLAYELLFKTKANSLVLIDEPEKSLHIGWQSQFLTDLKEITKLTNSDVLIATNSPDIIQDTWEDLTVEMKS